MQTEEQLRTAVELVQSDELKERKRKGLTVRGRNALELEKYGERVADLVAVVF
jgi:hypothetical protein